MSGFELFLIPEENVPVDREALWRSVDACPHIARAQGDRHTLIYYNRRTTVHFSMVVSEALCIDAEPDELLAGGIPDEIDALSESPAARRRSRLDEEEREEDDEEGDDDEDQYDDQYDEDEDEEDDDEPELPSVSVHLPLFRPTFFLLEAHELLRRLEADTGLRLIAAEGEATGDAPPESSTATDSREALLESWREKHREAFAAARDKSLVEVWPEARCAAFYDYNSHLGELESEFGPAGLEVLPIQAARHEGATKTLCVWRCDRPAILPGTDLVLVQRPRARRLLGGTKIEELVVDGAALWRILEAFGETRHVPARMLILRTVAEPPASLRAYLEDLRGESTANARRTELAGVVDFELGGPRG